MRKDGKNESTSLELLDQAALDKRVVHAGKQIALATGLGMSSVIAGILWFKGQSKLLFGAATVVSGIASVRSAIHAYRECEAANVIEDRLIQADSNIGARNSDEGSHQWIRRTQSHADNKSQRLR